jgi:hypothetical protein
MFEYLNRKKFALKQDAVLSGSDNIPFTLLQVSDAAGKEETVVCTTQHGNNTIPGWYSHGIWLSHDEYPTSIMPLYSVVDILNAFY